MKKALLYILVLCCASGTLAAQDGWDFKKMFKKHARTWEDSGYYLQIEFIDIRVQKMGVTSGGDGKIKVRFRSSDPVGQQYNGTAIMTYAPGQLPPNLDLNVGTRAIVSMVIGQSVLICPSPEQEAGLGQNDPVYPLYYSGFLLEVEGNVIPNPTPLTIQLLDIEIIL